MTREEAEASVAANLEFTASLTALYPRGQDIMSVIRRKCLDCCAGDRAEVMGCEIRRCALWPYRLGPGVLRGRRRAEKPQDTGTPDAAA